VETCEILERTFEESVMDLRAFTNYSCAVKLLNSAGWSEESSRISVQTLESGKVTEN
jgi:hypothetical protein